MNMKFKTLIAMASIAATMVTTATAFAAEENKTSLERNISVIETSPVDMFDITNSSNTTSFMGKALTPDVELYDGSKRFVKGIDYELSFTFQTLDSLRTMVCSKRKQLLPEGVDDEIVHIAVVPDQEMSEEIKLLGFDSYCIPDENNMPNYYEWE